MYMTHRQISSDADEVYRMSLPQFSEHVYFVQICPVFAGPVTYGVSQRTILEPLMLLLWLI